MRPTLRLEATVLPGHRLEVNDPELPEGAKVEVIVVLPDKTTPASSSMFDLIACLPPGPRAFATWEEYEQRLREEKDSWER
jgi:hypothetical protein